MGGLDGPKKAPGAAKRMLLVCRTRRLARRSWPRRVAGPEALCRMADGDVRYACRLRSSGRQQHREPQHGAPVGKALVWAPRQGCKVGEQIKCDQAPPPPRLLSCCTHYEGRHSTAHCVISQTSHPTNPTQPPTITRPPHPTNAPRHRHHLSTITTSIQRAVCRNPTTQTSFQTTTCIDAPRGSPLVLF